MTYIVFFQTPKICTYTVKPQKSAQFSNETYNRKSSSTFYWAQSYVARVPRLIQGIFCISVPPVVIKNPTHLFIFCWTNIFHDPNCRPYMTSMWWDFYKGNTDSPDILGLRQRWWNSPVLLTHHLFQTSVFFGEKFDQQLRLGPIQFTLHPNEVVSKQDFFFQAEIIKVLFLWFYQTRVFFFPNRAGFFVYIYIHTCFIYKDIFTTCPRLVDPLG